MSQAAPTLSQYLLTRSDLATLEVPAAEVMHWLAAGWLEHIGTLPAGAMDGDANPVLAVTDRELARDLASRLTEIGKDTVVFSPLLARSVLTRALLALHVLGTTTPPQPPEIARAVEASAREHQATAAPTGPSLTSEEFDQLAAQPGGVDAFLAHAREAARLDAQQFTEPGALSDASAAEEEEDLFDFSDINSMLDTWTGEEHLAAANDGSDDTEERREGQEQHGEPDMSALNVSSSSNAEAMAAPEAAATVEPIVEDDGEWPEIEVEVDEDDDPFQNDPRAEGIVDPEVAAALAYDPGRESAEKVVAEEADEEPALAEIEAAIVAAETDSTDEVEPEAAAMLSEDRLPPAAEADDEDPTDARPEALAEEDPTAAPEVATDNEPAHTSEPLEDDAAAEVEPLITPDEVALPTAQPAREPAMASTAAMTESASAATMERVEGFLGELRGTLVDLAQQSPAPTIDMTPLVAAVGEFGQRVEHGVAVGVHAAMNSQPKQAAAAVAPLSFVRPRANRTPLLLLAISTLLLCWGAILWFKTGNAQLALGTVIGANVVGCCLLIGRR